jgi:hypothetical protein
MELRFSITTIVAVFELARFFVKAHQCLDIAKDYTAQGLPTASQAPVDGPTPFLVQSRISDPYCVREIEDMPRYMRFWPTSLPYITMICGPLPEHRTHVGGFQGKV